MRSAAADVSMTRSPAAVPSRLSLNQATIKYASLRQALDTASRAGISSVGLWREPVAEVGLAAATRMVRASGLRVSSLCRGGFFTVPTGPDWVQAMDANRRAVEETAALVGAAAEGSRAVLVLVAGGLPSGSRDIRSARGRVEDAVAELVPYAKDHGVQLAIEPLHPMYAADRAVVSTLEQALDITAPHPADTVGVVVDAFHVWWDPALQRSIMRAGTEHRIASFQVCDWVTPIAADPLLARGLPGSGHIDFADLSSMVTAAGFTGDVEVEVFNQAVWDTDFDAVAAEVVRTVTTHVPL